MSEIPERETENDKQTRVAEIHCNYDVNKPLPKQILSQRFEHVIKVNRSLGYHLRDWKISQIMNAEQTKISETIIAIFEKEHYESERAN